MSCPILLTLLFGGPWWCRPVFQLTKSLTRWDLVTRVTHWFYPTVFLRFQCLSSFDFKGIFLKNFFFWKQTHWYQNEKQLVATILWGRDTRCTKNGGHLEWWNLPAKRVFLAHASVRFLRIVGFAPTKSCPAHPFGYTLCRERIWMRRKRKLSPLAMSRGLDFLWRV